MAGSYRVYFKFLSSAVRSNAGEHLQKRRCFAFANESPRPGIEAFSLVMFLIVTKAFPQAAVVGDVFTLLNHIKQFFDLHPVHDEQAESLKLYNDDLAGFFTPTKLPPTPQANVPAMAVPGHLRM